MIIFNVSMGKSYAYYTYYQRKGHATSFCKALEVEIWDQITQGRYKIDQKDSDLKVTINIVSVDKEVYAGLQRGNLRHIPYPITIEQVSIPHYLKTYSMIEQLKTTPTKISFYDLISTSETYREILYALFKKKLSLPICLLPYFQKNLDLLRNMM